MHHPGNHVFYRPRPAGPPGYGIGRGYYDDMNYYYGHHHVSRSYVNGPRAPARGSRHNGKTEDRREDNHGLRAAMSNLTLEGPRNRPPAPMGPRMQNTGYMAKSLQNGVQLPLPPAKWIKPESGNNSTFRRHDKLPQKQVRQVYQVKTPKPQTPPDSQSTQ